MRAYLGDCQRSRRADQNAADEKIEQVMRRADLFADSMSCCVGNQDSSMLSPSSAIAEKLRCVQNYLKTHKIVGEVDL